MVDAMHTKIWGITSTLLTAALLAGCGGGSGNSAPVSVVPTRAEGAYAGTISNGQEHSSVVLENDDYYAIYGKTLDGVFRISGFLHGSGTSLNGGFSSADLKDFYYTGVVQTGSLNATYVPGVSFSGTITENGASLGYTGTAINPSSYNYNTGATLANVVGAWTISDLSGETASLSVSASGAFTTSSGGCISTGTVTPRASGKNVFDVNVKYGAVPCLLAGQTAKGIGLEYIIAGGKRQLMVALENAARTSGTIYFGLR